MSKLHKVDPSTITETSEFKIIQRFPGGTAIHTVLRKSDGEVFTINDVVTNGTPMKGKITGFNITVSEIKGEVNMWVTHTWSGVGMALQNLKKLMALPSLHQFGDPVLVYFVPDAELVKLGEMEVVPDHYTTEVEKLFTEVEGKMVPKVATRQGIRARIHGIHFFPGKIKYDLDLSFTGGANTRIYNIDSIFVFADRN